MDASHDKIRVGVVDDHHLIVVGVRAVLSASHSPTSFVAGAKTVGSLLRRTTDLDVVLLDVRLADGSSLHANLTRLTDAGVPVLLHSDVPSVIAFSALDASGAYGVVCKNDPTTTLLDALATVGRGCVWSDRSKRTRRSSAALTHRETEVVHLYASGLTYAQIAMALTPPVGVESVKTYLARVRRRYQQLGRPATNRLELRQRVIDDGLLSPDR